MASAHLAASSAPGNASRFYDVEADWTLLRGCNFRCTYCFSPPEVLATKIGAHARPEKWQEAFDATGLTWLLHITGGEPTAYPEFSRLCQLLTQRHHLSVNTNLSLDTVLSLIGAVDPQRIRFIHAAFHPNERERKNGIAAFVRRAVTLRDAGFTMLITMVATPEVLANFDEMAGPIRDAGLAVTPKILRENFQGKRYPDAYSEVDKARFRTALLGGQTAYQNVLDGMGEAPTINFFSDEDYLGGVPSFKGRTCDAGYKFVAITPEGDVSLCGGPQLGNMLDGSLRLRDKSSVCNTTYCVYFCAKYAQPAVETPEGALLGWGRRLLSRTNTLFR
ncbi:radical SAM protein [Mesorhizobium shangrilense]|uniref:Radical SAM protein n=1 Tax=Mesorhizobium shangrilense TaxID=460060 RepID=A0ABV2DIN5_9HYPH